MVKTKIVCTIGPTSSSYEVIYGLIENGMNVARLNFSHGTHEEHREKIKLIRDISESLKKPVAILQDLCGPKIRVGEIPDPGIQLKPGQTIILTNESIDNSEKRISVSYKNLPKEVKEGDIILLADGMLEMVVVKTTDIEIYCEVITGGILTSHKGINLPTGTIKADSLTEKDKSDLIFGLNNDVDYIALSFVRNPADIINIKNIIKSEGKNIPVIAKIEKHEALECIDAIMDVSDGIMVARGDLGVEIPLENVPNIQKMLVKKSNLLGKPVIIATQMLRSMVTSPRPTRAEATDVANAVLDGADAVMLSEETASGNYPIQAVQFMRKILQETEKEFPHGKYLQQVHKEGVSESVAHACCVLSDYLHAKVIIATTTSGSTAMRISKFRPKATIFALSPDNITVRRLALYWGCNPSILPKISNTDELFEQSSLMAIASKYAEHGDLAVITAGHPIWVEGTTNMLKVISL